MSATENADDTAVSPPRLDAPALLRAAAAALAQQHNHRPPLSTLLPQQQQPQIRYHYAVSTASSNSSQSHREISSNSTQVAAAAKRATTGGMLVFHRQQQQQQHDEDARSTASSFASTTASPVFSGRQHGAVFDQQQQQQQQQQRDDSVIRPHVPSLSNVRRTHSTVAEAVLGIRVGAAGYTIGRAVPRGSDDLLVHSSSSSSSHLLSASSSHSSSSSSSVFGANERAYRKGIFNAQSALRDIKTAAMRNVLAFQEIERLSNDGEAKSRNELVRDEMLSWMDLRRRFYVEASAIVEEEERRRRREIGAAARRQFVDQVLSRFSVGASRIQTQLEMRELLDGECDSFRVAIEQAQIEEVRQLFAQARQQRFLVLLALLRQEEHNLRATLLFDAKSSFSHQIEMSEQQQRFRIQLAQLQRDEEDARNDALGDSHSVFDQLAVTEMRQRRVLSLLAKHKHDVFFRFSVDELCEREQLVRSRLIEEESTKRFSELCGKCERGASQIAARQSCVADEAMQRDAIWMQFQTHLDVFIAVSARESLHSIRVQQVVRAEEAARATLEQLASLSGLAVLRGLSRAQAELCGSEQEARLLLTSSVDDERRKLTTALLLGAAETEDSAARRHISEKQKSEIEQQILPQFLASLFFVQRHDFFEAEMTSRHNGIAVEEQQERAAIQLKSADSARAAAIAASIAEAAAAASFQARISEMEHQEQLTRAALSQVEKSERQNILSLVTAEATRIVDMIRHREAKLQAEEEAKAKAAVAMLLTARSFVGFSLIEKGMPESFHLRRHVYKPLLVHELYIGGPADHADLKLGDVLVSVNGHPVTSLVSVRGHLASSTAGSTLRIVVRRCTSATAEQRIAAAKARRAAATVSHPGRVRSESFSLVPSSTPRGSNGGSVNNSSNNSSRASSCCGGPTNDNGADGSAPTTAATSAVSSRAGSRATSASATPVDSNLVLPHQDEASLTFEEMECRVRVMTNDARFAELGEDVFFDTKKHHKVSLEEEYDYLF